MLPKLAVVALATTILLPPALAGGDDGEPKPHRPDNFWEWIIDPHGAEISVILQKSRDNRRRATTEFPVYDDYQGFNQANQQIHDQLLADARGMLKYASKLEPDNPELLLEMGLVADEAGETSNAIAALERYLEVALDDEVAAEAYFQLGLQFAKLRQWRRAISNLQQALGRSRRLAINDINRATRHLACIYMQVGRMAEAIDLLDHAQPIAFQGARDQVVEFTLAVAYDRDEQLTQAYEVLDRLMRNNQYGTSMVHLFTTGYQRGPMLFTPPNDRHYFYALLYEVAGNLHSARSEWLTYTRGGDDAPFRDRAMAHIAAIDRLLDARMSGKQPASTGSRQPPPAPPVRFYP